MNINEVKYWSVETPSCTQETLPWPLALKTEERSVTYIHTNSAFCDGKTTVLHTRTFNDDNMLLEYYNFRTQGGTKYFFFISTIFSWYETQSNPPPTLSKNTGGIFTFTCSKVVNTCSFFQEGRGESMCLLIIDKKLLDFISQYGFQSKILFS